LTGVKQHVLRYWESEFAILRPQRAQSRQRLYRKSDVENILRIKRLLKEEGYTISGAKKLLEAEKRAVQEERESQEEGVKVVAGIKQELLALKKLLEGDEFGSS